MVKKLGILADTRIRDKDTSKAFTAIRGRLQEIFNGCDLIIHAGNICTESVLEDLECIAPVVAVKGSLDNQSDFTRKLPKFDILDIDDYIIGVFNEIPSLDLIKEKKINILVHGNTCIPTITESRELRLSLDPGSPIFPAKYDRGTVILLKIGTLLFSYVVKV